MTRDEFFEVLRSLFPSATWPKPLHLLQGYFLVEEGLDAAEAYSRVGTNTQSLQKVIRAGDPIRETLGTDVDSIEPASQEHAVRILGQLVLGRCAELAFEEIYRNEMETGELELRDLREGRTDTDYRLHNDRGRPVFRVNIKFHGARFRSAAELVGLEPQDCFALATYKIHSALQKQEEDQLPYIFAVVGVPHLSGEVVGRQIPTQLIDAAALIHQAPRAQGKRNFEDTIVSHLVAQSAPVFEGTLNQILAADWYIISARRAANLLSELLFDRVYALRIRGFARAFRGAELDMHFSLSQDLTPLRRFLHTLREGGAQRVTTLLERGDF